MGQYKSNPYENFKDKYITIVLSAHIELYIYLNARWKTRLEGWKRRLWKLRGAPFSPRRDRLKWTQLLHRWITNTSPLISWWVFKPTSQQLSIKPLELPRAGLKRAPSSITSYSLSLSNTETHMYDITQKP